MSSVATTLQVRAAANKWVSDNFPEQRCHISHSSPVRHSEGWSVELQLRSGSEARALGELVIHSSSGKVELAGASTTDLELRLESCLTQLDEASAVESERLTGQHHDFRFGDGIEGSRGLEDLSIDLLLTDPPYGISNPYTCEKQVPRRLRKDGKDFIMPKGHFGDWDNDFPSPEDWTRQVLPKVRGWAVIFCAQTQIGDYVSILQEYKFSAVGPMVWHKTNPVPFNHKYKPINAWEAMVVGKRPGTQFNGHVVHNVFTCKSPSPQQRIHPTQKPLPLVSEFVTLFSNQGDKVLDPFAGSATTVIAAMNQGRDVLAFEKSPEIYNAACDRIKAEIDESEKVRSLF